MTFVGEHLDRVVILSQEGDGPVRLLSAELFADGLVVRWMRRPHPPLRLGDLDVADYVGFSVRDDVGTTYHRLEEQAASMGEGYHGHTAFTPAVPADAAEFVVGYLGDDARVSLRTR